MTNIPDLITHHERLEEALIRFIQSGSYFKNCGSSHLTVAQYLGINELCCSSPGPINPTVINFLDRNLYRYPDSQNYHIIDHNMNYYMFTDKDPDDLASSIDIYLLHSS